jgi:hypothetical protein
MFLKQNLIEAFVTFSVYYCLYFAFVSSIFRGPPIMMKTFEYTKAVMEADKSPEVDQFIVFEQSGNNIYAYLTEAKKLYDLGLCDNKHFYIEEFSINNKEIDNSKFDKIMDILQEKDIAPLMLFHDVKSENTPKN